MKKIEKETTKRRTGTREWAEYSANCAFGCSNGCRYCYARAQALKESNDFPDPDSWLRERIDAQATVRKWEKLPGIIMFPTRHDITERNFDACVNTLINILVAGNQVLVVSKPRLELITNLLEALPKYVSTAGLSFRFTVGTLDETTAGYWEPGAPSIGERLEAAKYALANKYTVGFSMEPALDSAYGVELTARKLISITNDQVWIGTMNKIDLRWVREGTHRDSYMMYLVENNLKPESIRHIYETFKDDKRVEWKDSYRKILGLPELPPPAER